MKKLIEEVAKIDPEAAMLLDYEFAMMAPAPLGANATEEERKKFNEQLEAAEAASDLQAEDWLKKHSNP